MEALTTLTTQEHSGEPLFQWEDEIKTGDRGESGVGGSGYHMKRRKRERKREICVKTRSIFADMSESGMLGPMRTSP
eukprot:1384187-Amorphochlora_amoeboformis.AAC.1